MLSSSPSRITRLGSSSDDNNGEQIMETIQSLSDFHEGRWTGVAKSFSVKDDVAAGIVQRSTSPPYKLSVKLGVDVANKDFKMTETLEWNDKLSSREISLKDSHTDVDAVDGSYSFDSTLPSLPAEIVGTDKLAQFVIEHCIAVNDDERARCLALYGMDQRLMRVVLCQESRGEEPATVSPDQASDSKSTFTAADLLEMQSDVDRLVDKLTGSSDSANNSQSEEDRLEALQSASSGKKETADQQVLKMHNANLLEMTSGVWLGDLIIRDLPYVPLSPDERGRGFGGSSKKQSIVAKASEAGFAKWSIGVQKAAWRWMWDFGEEIRQVLDFGRAMGAEYAGSPASLPGVVCVNEGMSRRIPAAERMVYVDWNSDDSVSFLSGPMSVQVPRFLTFDSNSKTQPSKAIFTEFGVFSSSPGEAIDPSTFNLEVEGEEVAQDNFDINALPEIACSKISRVYNYEGLLKQGCTSFYTLKRFGAEKDDKLA